MLIAAVRRVRRPGVNLTGPQFDRRRSDSRTNWSSSSFDSHNRIAVWNESARGRARGARTAPEEELRRKPIAAITQQDRLRA